MIISYAYDTNRMLYVFQLIPTLNEGYILIVSVHRMVTEIVLLTLAESRGVTDLNPL